MHEIIYKLKHFYAIPAFFSIYTEQYEILSLTTYLSFISLLCYDYSKCKLLNKIKNISYLIILFYVLTKKNTLFLTFLIINCIFFSLLSYFSIIFQILFDCFFVCYFILSTNYFFNIDYR